MGYTVVLNSTVCLLKIFDQNDVLSKIYMYKRF